MTNTQCVLVITTLNLIAVALYLWTLISFR